MTGDLFDDVPESATGWYTAHCDGGSRGNPGPSGFGAVIEDPDGRVAVRLSHFLGTQTNNFAEYSALLAVLEWALKHEVKRLRVVSDSELMVRQMKGQYKVSNAGLLPLWEEARRRAAWLERFDIRHTLRGGNQEADRLANEAMDRGMGKNREQGSGSRDQGSAGQQVSGSASRRVPSTPAGLPNPIEGAPGPSRLGTGAEGGPEDQRGPRPGSARAGAEGSANRQPHGKASGNRHEQKTLSGYVKNGTVHLLDGELPDGIFVKVIPE